MNDTAETLNAIIQKADIFIEDHGMLTAFLDCKLEWGNQGFGGYHLDEMTSPRLNFCGLFIRQCLEIAGVDHWHQLPGKCIRVKREAGLIKAIGHIVEDKWFEPRKVFEEIGK